MVFHTPRSIRKAPTTSSASDRSTLWGCSCRRPVAHSAPNYTTRVVSAVNTSSFLPKTIFFLSIWILMVDKSLTKEVLDKTPDNQWNMSHTSAQTYSPPPITGPPNDSLVVPVLAKAATHTPATTDGPRITSSPSSFAAFPTIINQLPLFSPPVTPTHKAMTKSRGHDGLALLFLLFVIVLSLFVSHIARHTRFGLWLPLPLVATLAGIILGGSLHWGGLHGDQMLQGILAFNDKVFFFFLLPPIIFQSGAALIGKKAEQFFENFGTTLWFAILGTMIAFLSIGSTTFLAGVLCLGPKFSMREAFAFGAAMSSTDPVAALTLLDNLGAPPALVAIISGESLLNDALSILLYRTMAKTAQSFNGLHLLLDFGSVLFGSIALGIAVSLVAALIYKHMKLHQDANRLLESALFLLFPWISYLVSEGVGMSPIVSILFSGIAMARYAYPNLSAVGKETSTNVFSALALLAESAAFIFLGIAVFSSHHLAVFDLKLYISTFSSVTFSRIVSTFCVSFLVNCFRHRKELLTLAEQRVIAFCGVRGAVAFALSLGSCEDFRPEAGAAMLSATLFYAVVSTIVMSLFFPFIVQPVVEQRSLSSASSGSRTGQRHTKNEHYVQLSTGPSLQRFSRTPPPLSTKRTSSTCLESNRISGSPARLVSPCPNSLGIPYCALDAPTREAYPVCTEEGAEPHSGEPFALSTPESQCACLQRFGGDSSLNDNFLKGPSSSESPSSTFTRVACRPVESDDTALPFCISRTPCCINTPHMLPANDSWALPPPQLWSSASRSSACCVIDQPASSLHRSSSFKSLLLRIDSSFLQPVFVAAPQNLEI